MIIFLQKIWIPFATSPEVKACGLCLLLMDSFSSHMTKTIKKMLSDCNTITEFVPKGYTAKLQVMDVGLNRLFKLRYEIEFHQYIRVMVHRLSPGEPIRPSRQDVSKWVMKVWHNIKPSAIVSTWRHVGFRLEDMLSLEQINQEAEEVQQDNLNEIEENRALHEATCPQPRSVGGV